MANLLSFPENVGNWSKQGATVVHAVALSPAGTTTAERLVETSGFTSHGVRLDDLVLTAASSNYTLSCHFKADTRTWVRIAFTNRDATTIGAYFNLGSGALGTATNGTAAIVAAANGFYRCSIIGDSGTASPSATSVTIGLANANNGNIYTGDGTSGLYVWGAVLELGALTAYVPVDNSIQPPATGASGLPVFGEQV